MVTWERVRRLCAGDKLQVRRLIYGLQKSYLPDATAQTGCRTLPSVLTLTRLKPTLMDMNLNISKLSSLLLTRLFVNIYAFATLTIMHYLINPELLSSYLPNH